MNEMREILLHNQIFKSLYNISGETNGPIILQVLSSAEERLNELDTGQNPPAPKRQKVMQLVTKTGQGLASQNKAVAKVSGQVR